MNNQLPYCITNMRGNPEPLNDGELKIIKSRTRFDNDQWWGNATKNNTNTQEQLP